MPTFQYRAIDATGKSVRGNLEAANDADLEARLQRIGLDLVTLRLTRPQAARFSRRGVTRQELITFCFHLEQVSRAGISLLEGLRHLRDGADNPRFCAALAAVLEDLEGGKTLSEALAGCPQVFDRLFVSVVRAGEQTGELQEAFANLAATLKWQDEIAAQAKRLLIYPALVFGVVACVVAFLMAFLVPQVVGLLQNLGVALPLQTRVLLFLSDALVNYWPAVLGLPVALAAGCAALARSNDRFSYRVDRMKLRLPLTGATLQKIILARCANFLALLYRSGIPVLDALKTCEAIAANRVIAAGLQRAGQAISEGGGLTESFRNQGLFPPLVIRMLQIGETTGALDESLRNVSYFYNREARHAIDQALKLLEPALTVLLGLIMAFVMGSVLLPVYDVIGKLKL